MRLEVPREAERLGANLFYGVQKVYEIDSGLRGDAELGEVDVIQRISYETLHDLTKRMAIVVPVRGERIKLLEGVLSGIPHHCLVIIVSNSDREPIDRFTLELNAIEKLVRFTQKNVILVHQKDPKLAEALADCGYCELLDDEGRVKDGKAEGMLVATILAKLAGKEYIGFIDADNYFPGAVHEYVWEYAAGFATARSNFTMVRIHWHSKPKIIDSSLFFAKYGRASVVTNRFLNALVGHYTGFETEVIKTGNSGEHAMTMELALRLSYASGYAVETQQLVDLVEKFGSNTTDPGAEVLRQYVEIYQIESRNPHLHDTSKGDEHIDEMIEASLRVIYHSPVCPPLLREEIIEELRRRKILNKKNLPAPPQYYPPLLRLDFERFAQHLTEQAYSRLLAS